MEYNLGGELAPPGAPDGFAGGIFVRILSIVLGLVLVVGGVMSIVQPAAMALSLGWLIGFFILVHGIGSLMNYYRFRLFADGWSVAGAVLSILLGALLMGSAYLQLATNLVIVFTAGVWMIAAGVVAIAFAVRFARASRSVYAWEKPSLAWVWLLLLGLLLTVLGIVAFVRPLSGVAAIGLLMGIYAISAGVQLIGVSCCSMTN
jgi:uncharacterized membrane protein HdeD (DUF308 family)